MSFKLISAAHSLGEANIHFQFIPKYRREVFRDEKVKEACEVCFRQVADELGVALHAVEFGLDHCHLFVGAYKNHSVAELAQRFKGTSSRMIRQTLWSEDFWCAGYFYRSVGSVTSEAMEWYFDTPNANTGKR